MCYDLSTSYDVLASDVGETEELPDDCATDEFVVLCGYYLVLTDYGD